MENSHGSRTWVNHVYRISHRVGLKVYDIVILMRSLWWLFTKYGTLLSLAKMLFGLVIFVIILVFFFLGIQSVTTNIYIISFCRHNRISLINVQNLSCLKIYWESRIQFNIFIGVDWMYMASIIQEGIKYPQLRKRMEIYVCENYVYLLIWYL